MVFAPPFAPPPRPPRGAPRPRGAPLPPPRPPLLSPRPPYPPVSYSWSHNFCANTQAGNSATQNLNLLRIRAARGCETDLDHRLLKILLVLLGHPLFLHRNRRVRHGLRHLVRLWVCMPSLCMLKRYNWRDVAVMELQLEFRENYFLPVAASAHWPKLVSVTWELA
jgi:hypothetical protein